MSDGPAPVATPPGEHLLPGNATPLERALSGADHRLVGLPTWVIRAVWDPATCPEALLPYLAQAWSVDEWDPAWTVAQKRAVIVAAPEIHRRKGTVWALKQAIGQLGLGAKVREWFRYGGQPYRFRISVELAPGADWTAAKARQLWRVAIATKNVRSWLEEITVIAPENASAPVFVGAVAHAHMLIDTAIGPVTHIDARDAYVFVGVHCQTRLLIDTVIA